MASLPFVIAGILTGIIICGFAWFMPARQTRLAHWKAFWDSGFLVIGAVLQSHHQIWKCLKFLPSPWPWASRELEQSLSGYLYATSSVVSGSYGPVFYPNMFVSDLNRCLR
jgi:hypothetical protein